MKIISSEKNDQRKLSREYTGTGKVRVCTSAAGGDSFLQIIKRVFLPINFPSSVREEYLEYQLFDSLQAVCSYLRGVLCVKAVLAGSGVGSAKASAISTAILWSCRDGSGMLGSLMFAFNFSNNFEVYVKEWRLAADLLNNIGLTLDLASSYLPPHIFLVCASISSICKACCGLVAGATKAKISCHFSINGSISDLTSKESTQETAVALIGLGLGAICAKFLDSHTQSDVLTWCIFICLLIFHQYANYRLIRTLIFDTLNPQRLFLIVSSMLSKDGNTSLSLSSSSSSPNAISKRETLLLPMKLSRNVRLGESINSIIESLNENLEVSQELTTEFEKLVAIWEGQPFVIALDKDGRAIICLEDLCTEEDTLRGFIIGCYLYQIHQIRKTHVDDNVAKESLQFYENKCSVEKLAALGWDITPHKTRLCDKGWRYRKSIAHKKIN